MRRKAYHFERVQGVATAFRPNSSVICDFNLQSRPEAPPTAPKLLRIDVQRWAKVPIFLSPVTCGLGNVTNTESAVCSVDRNTLCAASASLIASESVLKCDMWMNFEISSQ